MLLVDSNEARNQPELVSLLRASLDVDVQSINQTSTNTLVYPDFVIFGGSKQVGINRKTVGEWLSSPDKVIEQVQRELAGPVEWLVLVIEGVMRAAGHTGMLAHTFAWNQSRFFNNSADAHGTVPFTQRLYAINPKHAQNEQTRLEFLGVQVVHTYSPADTASKIISFHDLVMKDEPNNVLSRLIKPEHHVTGLTVQETKFARQLLAFDGVGEQAALTIAASFTSIGELMRYWTDNGTIADMVMTHGTRRIGNALERKLQQGLGYEAPGNPAADSLRQDPEASPVP